MATVIQDREDNVVRSNTSASYQAIYDLCENYGIHSSADLSNAPEAVSALAAGTNPEAHAAAPPEATETQASPETEEATAILEEIDDGLTSEPGEAADLSTEDGMEPGGAVELSGGEADYDDGGGEVDAAPSAGESGGTIQDDGLDDGKSDGKGAGTGLSLGGAAPGNDGATQNNDDDYTP